MEKASNNALEEDIRLEPQANLEEWAKGSPIWEISRRKKQSIKRVEREIKQTLKRKMGANHGHKSKP